MKKNLPVRTIQGEASWRLATPATELYVTERGGHTAPLTFFRNTNRPFTPLSVAPWAGEKLRGEPEVVRILRGDFFCLPFGGNAAAWRGERHPVHGETANRRWSAVGAAREGPVRRLHLRLRTRARPGEVDKYLTLVDGQDALYIRHEIRGMSGPMPLGHHAMLRFPDAPESGRVSTSPFLFGQVFPGAFENPEAGGYSMLKAGAEFDSLERVPTADGGSADLTRYPARRGFEDLLMLVGDPAQPLAWNAVVFPSAGVAWFTLRNPAVLTHTVFWISNGGRHYAPWSGRHVGVLGIEDVTSFFHLGLAESARPNALSRRGHPTCIRLRKDRVLSVPYIMAAAAVPRGFDAVASIEPDGDRGVVLAARSGRTVRCALDLSSLG